MRLRTTLLLLPLVMPLPSCVVAAVAGATYGIVKYRKNEAERDFKAPIDQVWKASIEALEGRGYGLPGALERELAERQDVAVIDGSGYWMRVEAQPGGWTRMELRIGTFQSEEHRRKAGLLLESIDSRL